MREVQMTVAAQVAALEARLQEGGEDAARAEVLAAQVTERAREAEEARRVLAALDTQVAARAEELDRLLDRLRALGEAAEEPVAVAVDPRASVPEDTPSPTSLRSGVMPAQASAPNLDEERNGPVADPAELPAEDGE